MINYSHYVLIYNLSLLRLFDGSCAAWVEALRFSIGKATTFPFSNVMEATDSAATVGPTMSRQRRPP